MRKISGIECVKQGSYVLASNQTVLSPFLDKQFVKVENKTSVVEELFIISEIAISISSFYFSFVFIHCYTLRKYKIYFKTHRICRKYCICPRF